jgi:hypothetical protein
MKKIYLLLILIFVILISSFNIYENFSVNFKLKFLDTKSAFPLIQDYNGTGKPQTYGWMPQPQYTVKDKDKDGNPVYAGTDICPGPFDIEKTGWELPKYLKDTEKDYIDYKSKKKRQEYEPKCVRSRNFDKNFKGKKWFVDNTYHYIKGQEGINPDTTQWPDYKNYLIKPYLERRSSPQGNYYWNLYLKKPNFFKVNGTTQGKDDDLTKFMCPVLNYTEPQKYTPGNYQSNNYKFGPKITPGYFGGVKYGDYYNKNNDEWSLGGNQIEVCINKKNKTECQKAGISETLYDVNGNILKPDYDSNSGNWVKGLCNWWPDKELNLENSFNNGGKCLINADNWNPLKECVLPSDKSEDRDLKKFITKDDGSLAIDDQGKKIKNLNYNVTRDIKGSGGCYVLPKFNWVIGVCQGITCSGHYFTPPPKPDDNSDEAITTNNLQPYKNFGTQLKLNYIAAYNFHPTEKKWLIAGDSSFNTDGSREPYDTIQAHGGLDNPEPDKLNNKDSKRQPWLAPMPGGAAEWGTGFYPIYAEGLGPGTKINENGENDESGEQSGGMLYVISTQTSFNFAWYMINQENINRGPIARPAATKSSPDEKEEDGYDCKEPSNCWMDGNAGEIDFLESAFASGKAVGDTIKKARGDDGINGAEVEDYRRLYLNNLNQFGRSFPSTVGSSLGGWNAKEETDAFIVGSDPKNVEEQPIIYCAVVDKIGCWVYRIPQKDKNGILYGNTINDDSVWKGLSRTQAAPKLDHAPKQPPNRFQAESDGHDGYTAIFIPNCQTKAGNDMKTMFCNTTASSGYCQNWFNLMSNTGQWQYKKPDKETDNKWEMSKAYANENKLVRHLSNFISGFNVIDKKLFLSKTDEHFNIKGVTDKTDEISDEGLGYNIDMIPFKCKNPFSKNGCNDNKIGRTCTPQCNKYSTEQACYKKTGGHQNLKPDGTPDGTWASLGCIWDKFHKKCIPDNPYAELNKLEHCCKYNDGNENVCTNINPCSFCNNNTSFINNSGELKKKPKDVCNDLDDEGKTKTTHTINWYDMTKVNNSAICNTNAFGQQFANSINARQYSSYLKDFIDNTKMVQNSQCHLPNLDELTDQRIQECQKTQEECKKCNGKWIINVINCPDQILLGNQSDSEIKNNTWNLPKDQECQIRNKCKIPDKSDFTSRDMFNCEQNEKNCTDICKGNWNLPNK